MRLHLPPSLRSALLASLVSFSGIYSYSHAATSADFWQIPDFGGPDFTWTGAGEGDAVGTAGNWEGGSAPSRVDNKGPHLIFNGVDVTVTGTPPNTSDGGGISVTGNGSVSVGLGQWGGNVYVEKGSSLTTSFSNQIKNTEAEGHANIYVDGILNMTTPGGNLNFDNGTGSGNHYWHIGLDGMVNLSNTTTITKNAKTWNVEVVVAGAMEELAVTNREMVDDALITRYFMSTGADLGASLDSLRIWKQTGDDTYEALTRVDSAGQLGAGNFLLVSNGSGMSVQYKGEGYDAETLVWNSNGTWKQYGNGLVQAG
jgi:outer membrane autotransporter barrel domain protein